MGLPLDGPTPAGPRTNPQDLYWLIRIRWIMIAVGGLAAIGTWLAGTITTEGFGQGVLLIGCMLLYNLTFLLVLRAATTPQRARWRTVVRWLQQPCDIISITLLLHLIPTGGVTPLTIFYGAAILSAILTLPPRGIYVVAAFAILCYAGLIINEFYLRPLPPAYTLLYYLRTSPDAARIAPNAVVVLVVAVSCIAFSAAYFARRLRDNAIQIRRQLADLTALHDELRERARRDSLTGVLNHGTLLEQLTLALNAATATASPVGLIMLDLDHFKALNDTWGHLVGDVALRAVAEAIQSSVRPSDVVGRWGGEEFVVVLPGATREEASRIATRIGAMLTVVSGRAVADQRWSPPTASQGIAVFPSDAASAVTLVDAADRALYLAKARGRNTIITDPPPHRAGEPVAAPAGGGMAAS